MSTDRSQKNMKISDHASSLPAGRQVLDQSVNQSVN